MYDAFATLPLIDLWLREDIGAADLTAQLMVDAHAGADFIMNARQPMVVAGIDVAAAVFARYRPDLSIETLCRDGEAVEKGTALLRLSGNARAILTAERTALNIVQHLSGIATLTAQYVHAISHTRARLLDTRKTIPGLRALEKHAAHCGGALNHRLSLDGGVLIKDNHIAVCGGIGAAIAKARAGVPVLTKIEVECDRLDQVMEALAAQVDLIMLDNMSLADMREAVKRVAGRVALEASGNVRLETLPAIAETGVDYISTSKITQSAPAVDIGLDAP